MGDKFKQAKKKIMRWVDQLSITHLFVMACTSLLVFAGIYWLLGLRAEGPISLPEKSAISLGNCLYFSIVTFTSLGYGDIAPRGISKAVASSEVVIGLAFLGIFIAKLSSAKQNYHLAQLYARDVQERLEDFGATLRSHRELCKEVLDTIKRGASPTRSLNHTIMDVYRTSLKIHAYISLEASNGDFLLETPIGAPARLMRRSAQLVEQLSSLACFPVSLHSQRQRRIATRVIGRFSEIARLVASNSEDSSIISEANSLATRCTIETENLEKAWQEVDKKFKKS